MNGKAMIVCMSRRTCLRFTTKSRACAPTDIAIKLIIIRDMWLTGFDAPCMHTMYIDKPMQGHSLMQAMARVNCAFRDELSGLIMGLYRHCPEL